MTGKKRKAFVAASLALSALFVFFAVGCGEKYTIFSPPKSTLTQSEEFALEQYGADELDDVRATLRADTMYVTERGLERAKPEILGDDYSLVYEPSTNTVTPYYEKKSGEYTAGITFKEYPYPGGKGNNNDANGFYKNTYADQAYELLGISPTAGDEEKQAAREKYYYYYKYMLMSQGYNLATEAQNRSLAGTLTQDWLKKHPSADLQYGAVEGEDNAVEKVIILDPMYRSYHATGLYLPAGEAVTVKVEGLKAGERIAMTVGLNNTMAWRGSNYNGAAASEKLSAMSGGSALPLKGTGSEAFFTNADALTAGGYFFDFGSNFVQSQWNRQNNRAAWTSAEFVFTENKEYTIGTHFGGIMHINPGNCYSSVKTTIRGAVETPHYILGVTTPEYYEKYLVSKETAPGVYAVIDTENGQLIGKADYMRQNTHPDEVEKLAYLWHSFFAVNESFTGGTYNRPNIVKFDQHVPAGAAVALGGYVYACPTGWFGSATSYRSLLNAGSWGILHEIGHNHGSAHGSVWGMGGGQEGEVRNNALTCLAYLKFCDIGSNINENGGVPAEHGFVAHPYSSLANTLNIKNSSAANDFNELGYFDALNIYTNIMHSFGVDKFYELLYTYKENPSYNFVEGGVARGNKRSDFAYRLSLVYGMNFRPYIDGIFKGNTTDGDYLQEQLSYMNSLPTYHPVANLYAGGIDGVKTGGDKTVLYGEEKEFDLLGKTITTADGAEILEVFKPEHGKLTDLGEGKYRYSFDPKYEGNTDSFSFDVRLSDGVCHRLTVYLRFTYGASVVSDYGATDTADLDTEIPKLSEKTPRSVVSMAQAGVPSFNNEAGVKNELRVAEFWYRAPESGEFSFSANGDDKSRLYFGNSFDSLEAKSDVVSYTAGYDDSHSFKVTLKEGEHYAFRLVNINTGGAGGAKVGVKRPNMTAYVDVGTSDIVQATVSDPSKVRNYVYEPRFILSKKDNAIASTMNSDKSEWEVLQAPEDIQGGRYVTEIMVDEETGEKTEFVTDKRSWLIDGQAGTMFHTVWTPNPTPATDENPDVFVIDTKTEQAFNYFRIIAPNRSDYRIKRYELLISSDNENYRKVSEGTASEPLAYSGTTAQLTFPQIRGRYWKLVVKETSANNGNYTVISELEAGIRSSAQMVYPSTSTKYFSSKGWSRVKIGDGSHHRSGLVWAEKKNSKMVIKIRSSSVSLYSDKGDGFGSAKIKLDGKLVETVSLQSDVPQSRCLIFNEEGLSEKKEHTVEIITTSNQPFNLDFIGASYDSVLINAPNIYKEKALTVSLVVFVLLFVAAVAALCVIFFVPTVREKVFGLFSKRSAPKKTENRETALSAKEDKKTMPPERPSATARTSAAAGTAVKPTQRAEAKPTSPAPKPTAAKQTPSARPTAQNTGTVRPAAKPTQSSLLTRPTAGAAKPSAPSRPAAPVRPAPGKPNPPKDGNKK